MAGIRNVLAAFCFIATGGLLFGYIIGLNSNIVTTGQLLCKESFTGQAGTLSSVGYRQCYRFSALEKGFFSALNLIGATLSSLFCFRFADSMGRKLEVQVGALLYLIGAAVAAFSPVLWAIYAGFAIYGLGIGFAMHAAPVYIAEIAPADIRGTLVSGKEAVVVTGIFLGFFFGFVFSGIETVGWRYGAMVSAVFALTMAIGITFVPQSPRFLVLQAARNQTLLGADQSQIIDARASLKFYRNASDDSEVESELQTMLQETSVSVGTDTASTWDAFRYPMPLVIGCGIVFFQQVTGQPSVLYFATDIFKDAGFGSSAALSSVGIGTVKLLATLFTVWRVDQYGRRPLLFAGIGMMAVSLAVLGAAFRFQECTEPGFTIRDCPDGASVLPLAWSRATVVALMAYVTGYQIGFGPIAWLLISEVFPLRVRGAALSIAAIVNFTSNIAMTVTQQVLQETVGASNTFFGYFTLALVSICFVWRVVPETKGKTLEQIEADLVGRGSGTSHVNLQGF